MAYTAGDVLARVVMSNATGLPADDVVNDFAFHCPAAPSDGALLSFVDLIDGFYNGLQTSGHRVSNYISQSINRSATHRIDFYTIRSPALGPPRLTVDWLGPQAPEDGTCLPNEVAGVLSMHADLTGVFEEVGATRPRARRRGRLYIGPLTRAACTSTANPTLATVFLDTLRQAAVGLADALDGGYFWAVWSRADETLRPIVGGWTDNAPDTQRRRGQAATARVEWVL